MKACFHIQLACYTCLSVGVKKNLILEMGKPRGFACSGCKFKLELEVPHIEKGGKPVGLPIGRAHIGVSFVRIS